MTRRKLYDLSVDSQTHTLKQEGMLIEDKLYLE